jgi:hypothetical protein
MTASTALETVVIAATIVTPTKVLVTADTATWVKVSAAWLRTEEERRLPAGRSPEAVNWWVNQPPHPLFRERRTPRAAFEYPPPRAVKRLVCRRGAPGIHAASGEARGTRRWTSDPTLLSPIGGGGRCRHALIAAPYRFFVPLLDKTHERPETCALSSTHPVAPGRVGWTDGRSVMGRTPGM